MESAVFCEHAGKPVEVKLVGQKSKKDTLGIIGIAISIISLALSGLAAIVSVKPQMIPWNQNHEQRALAGDIEAQMYLGNFYYQIGDIESSIEYYSMVAEQTKLKTARDKERFFVACSNLGYLYMTKIGGEVPTWIALDYLEMGMRMLAQFDYPPSCGETLTKNYLLWRSAPSVTNPFPSSSYGVTFGDDVLNEFWDREGWPADVDESCKELYSEDPHFRRLYDHDLVSDVSDYLLFFAGYWSVGFVSVEEDAIDGGIYSDDLEAFIYEAMGGEALGVEKGDILIESDYFVELEKFFIKNDSGRFDSDDMHEIPLEIEGKKIYSVYRELARADAFGYIRTAIREKD